MSRGARFADEIRLLADLEPSKATERVLEAFEAIPREPFAGPGPWTVRSPLYGIRPRRTPDDDQRWLYHCVLVALDEAKGINIGEPSLWARLFARIDLASGSRILQIGAGTGYYTALLSHIVTDAGHVVATEIEGELLARAKVNLADRPNVELRDASDGVEGSFDLIVAFAGATHVPEEWREALADDGRILVPLTASLGWGAMVLAEPDERGFVLSTLGACGFYPCIGARDEALGKRLDRVWSDRTRLDGWKLRITGRGTAIRYEVDGEVI